MRFSNTFIANRMALARFRKKIPFLESIPDEIYHSLYPSEWYEPFGEIEQARRELEEKLNCHVVTFKRHRPFIPWERQLVVYIKEANLTSEQRGILLSFNDAFRDLGIEFETYQKPLKMRKHPLEHPFAHCDPPEGYDEHYGQDDVNPDDIPF